MAEDYSSDDLGSDEGISQELCVPTENLKLEDRDLLLHGITAPFRFATTPRSPVSQSPESLDNTEAYVLMVDGVDEIHYKPDFDWSRYLPAQVPLDRREHDKILDLCFKFFTMWCMRIVPALFLRDMHRALSVPRSQQPPKTPHYSMMLHNALIALASAFSDDPRVRDLKSRQYFAAAAKNAIEEECQKPNISVVHALSILGSFHSSQGEQMLGYMYFVGLAVDASAWVRSGLISHDDMLDRNWTYWTTLSQDACWSLYVGREVTLPPPPDHQTIPIPFIDSDMDETPWYYPQANMAPQPNYLSRTFAASCELLAIARRIMTVIVQLNSWRGQLAPEVDITTANRATSTPHRIMMHCTYWWAFILLHRPFFHRKVRQIHGSDREVDHDKLCKRSAENIMELLSTWRSLYTLRYAPITLVQVIFSCGTIFLLLAAQAASGLLVAKGTLKAALSDAELCIQYLFEIGKSWPCATNIGGILRSLLQEQLHLILARNSSNDASTAGESSRRLNMPPSPASTLSPSQLAASSVSASVISQAAAEAHTSTSSLGSSDQPEVVFSFSDLFSHQSGMTASETSGLLAMLGGETIPSAPFIAPFSPMDPDCGMTPSFDTLGYLTVLPFSQAPDESNIPASELADLESFWRDYFGSSGPSLL
ncbi:hypothetical protein C8J57DRAFT_1309251 [Mycena rebaudengoi]|nr:hypothetical protein C8J57DRAFT_1309251 [Mycena rebaudengoi]